MVQIIVPQTGHNLIPTRSLLHALLTNFYLARDIPVFHEVAGDFAFYFPNSDSAALADSLRHWLQLHAEGQAPRSADMPYLTWAQSTQQLLKVILENHWYTT